ncbi:MAG TPA: hypothetical protein VGH57_16805 [Amycolatopsis sp.]|jgi:hypothetical protein
MTGYFSTGASGGCQTQLDALRALCNGGTLKIYTGTQHDPDVTSITDTLLATFTFSATAFSGSDTVSGSFNTKTVTTPAASFAASTVSAAATNTAAWFGLFTSGATLFGTGTVGTSGADLNFNSVAFSSGANITISGFTLTLPE